MTTEVRFQDLFYLGMKRAVGEILPMPDGTVLDLGPGFSPITGAIGLDLPDWDAEWEDIPHGDGTVAGIHCYHFLEHLSDPIRMIREIQRVLQPGGVVNIVVPYYTSNMMAHDLTHKSFFSEATWDNL